MRVLCHTSAANRFTGTAFYLICTLVLLSYAGGAKTLWGATVPGDGAATLTLADLSEAEIRAVIPRQGLAVRSRDPRTGQKVSWGFDPKRPEEIAHDGHSYPNARFPLDRSEAVRTIGGHTVTTSYHERDGQRYYLELAVDNARWEWLVGQMSDGRLVKAYQQAQGAEQRETGDKIVLTLELLADRYPYYVASDQNPARKHCPAGHAPFNVTDGLFPFDNGPLLVTGGHSKAWTTP